MKKTLIISDLHIGDARLTDEGPIIDLLLNEDYELLVLNGDIVDCWILGYKKVARKSNILETLRYLRSKKEIVWVRGNHDQIPSNQKHIPGILVCESFRFDRYLAVHGHQVYLFKDMAWYSKVLANINSALYWAFKIDIQSWIRKLSVYEKRVAEKREELLEKYGIGGGIVLIGHTHLAGTQAGRNKLIYDGGSTMLTGNYLYIDEIGRVEHRQIKE